MIGYEFSNIVIENDFFKLVLRPTCVAESLVCKATGEECLYQDELVPLFSFTEDRPFNNEIKLAHPNKRTVFEANSVRFENGKLIVGFELVKFEAVINVKVADKYISFELEDFLNVDEHFGELTTTLPPIREFRLLQLPVKNRENFGEWLNVIWDEKACVNVLGASPYSRIDSEKRKGFRILTADTLSDIKLKNVPACIVVGTPEELLDGIDSVEEDYDLPKGVKSRRSKQINSSIYWTDHISPLTVDEHIEYAKKGGFSMMLIYYTALFKEDPDGYSRTADYDFKDEYPNGISDLKKMVDKIKAAGITPGFHFLHPHIGIRSRYITPVTDRRVNLKRYFTLAKSLGENDTTVYVEENPAGSEMHEKCRVLTFMGESIYYESFTTEEPYCFKGCRRGHFDTNIRTHEAGTIGGILDITEYGGSSAYVNQNTNLQDEIADKLAAAYNCGFEFAYYDGSEGTNKPYEIYIPLAQYRVYKKFDKAPLFCEGAAKANFSWHMLSGGNAFDIFKPEVFKEKLAEHPAEEAPRMAKDFTRLNFGWWAFFDETQADMYEYGTSKAAAWDCPVTVMENTERFKKHARTDDILEVMRRWEYARANNILTKEMKEKLKDTSKEFIMLINENGEYELREYERIHNAAGENSPFTAYILERNGKNVVVMWHHTGNAVLKLPLDVSDDMVYEKELGGERIDISASSDEISVSVAERRYFTSSLSKSELIEAFEKATLV